MDLCGNTLLQLKVGLQKFETQLYWTANEESLQTKKILAKKILCKEKDAKKAKKAKKNIGDKSLILHYFPRKNVNIMKKFRNLNFFDKIAT